MEQFSIKRSLEWIKQACGLGKRPTRPQRKQPTLPPPPPSPELIQALIGKITSALSPHTVQSSPSPLRHIDRSGIRFGVALETANLRFTSADHRSDEVKLSGSFILLDTDTGPIRITLSPDKRTPTLATLTTNSQRVLVDPTLERISIGDTLTLGSATYNVKGIISIESQHAAGLGTGLNACLLHAQHDDTYTRYGQLRRAHIAARHPAPSPTINFDAAVIPLSRTLTPRNFSVALISDHIPLEIYFKNNEGEAFRLRIPNHGVKTDHFQFILEKDIANESGRSTWVNIQDLDRPTTNPRLPARFASDIIFDDGLSPKIETLDGTIKELTHHISSGPISVRTIGELRKIISHTQREANIQLSEALRTGELVEVLMSNRTSDFQPPHKLGYISLLFRYDHERRLIAEVFGTHQSYAQPVVVGVEGDADFDIRVGSPVSIPGVNTDQFKVERVSVVLPGRLFPDDISHVCSGGNLLGEKIAVLGNLTDLSIPVDEYRRQRGDRDYFDHGKTRLGLASH